ARRLAAIGELYALRAPDDDVEKQHWVIDGFTGLVVEVAAAFSSRVARVIASTAAAAARGSRCDSNICSDYARPPTRNGNARQPHRRRF
ncbi:hypothetical protein, partial [Staphylococcus aureus]|uniref:hypothetical protein n=1 Tax=Staphylococcus aureus TaxID=1280 RepID=UPI001F43458E